MKDSPFLTNVVSADTITALQAAARSPALTFSDMVKLTELDPKRHLRHADLSGTNLTDADLRGFDLTGADLRGAVGIRVKWDRTTNLEGADLAGSILAAPSRLTKLLADNVRAQNLLKAVGGTTWADQVIWAATHLRSTGKYNDIAIPVAEALFYRATDDFLKAELLRYIAPRMASQEALREMLFAAASDNAGTGTLIKTVLRQFRRLGLYRDPAARQIALYLIDSQNLGVREEAMEFLLRTSPTSQEIETIRNKATTGDIYIGTLLVAETARRLGEAYDLITRDPITNATLPLGAKINPRMRDLIARRWLRAESSKEERNVALAMRRRGRQYQDNTEIAERAGQITLMWRELERHGVRFEWSNNSIESDMAVNYSIDEDK
jgi:hypothetical protein